MNTGRTVKTALLLGAIVIVSACATASGPAEIDTSEGAELSFDGLYPVKNTSRFTKVWAREGFDLSGYTKILLQGGGIEYRPVKNVSRTAISRSSASEFPVSEKTKAQVRDIFAKAFTDELANVRGFEVVTEPGPDVLIVRGYLLDVVSKVPPEPIGRSEIYLSSVGEATLVIELVDPDSEAALLRAIQRGVAGRNRSGSLDMTTAIWSNPVTNMAEVRRLASSWATRVRSGLEELADTYKIGTER
ncbi:MAG: DUF3313 domain-containing protein [Gammaproteobacteria bacterium]|nr:DUF3313 domain-containing protein [Gammaproteobacteria bacterium]MDH4314082.1 DUF3313 domain-containing protein [Gammaproteobacteria bacterium]MDH5213125.1 DUF3313 domain-containing protein [Gammaproteobacteria bacterium]